MSNNRRSNGEETRYRLLDWVGSQTPAERLSSHILNVEGYKSIDPSHPFGGRDGTKDMLCVKNGYIWVGACYFPRGKQTFGTIRKKFLEDLSGVPKNQASGLAFVTNQEITLSKRKELMNLTHFDVDIFHLDRIVNILNFPHSYGARQDFLDINMTKEEEVSAYAFSSKQLKELLYKLFEIKPNENVYNSCKFDPTVGSAAFLLSALKEINYANTYKDEEFDGISFSFKSLDYINDPNINLKDDLSTLLDRYNYYDVIIADPTIMLNEDLELPLLKGYQLTTANQLNILHHTILSLKKNRKSRAAIVLSDRALGDNSGKEIRSKLIEGCHLHTILRLPHGFYGEGKEEMNVLFFSKGKEEKAIWKDVWIYDLRNISLNKNESIKTLFEKFMESYKKRNLYRDNWYIISLEEIRVAHYNLDFSSRL
ncbi:N-6 DNA methylase [Priestia aryabhattai]|uniref:HsdM family class I SAM-dependent methyltransferase n=1 Tax=Priestia aryabhattai TaxID=412384 RepID=UPI002E1C7935|nr:N-6 DNA methylase [Priestia aryabhattai]MED4006070.1 N-6 DNA methylase [Priestia aryabhattai]